MDDLPVQPLGVSETEAQRRFDDLQRKLVPLWASIQDFTQDPQTVVVVPSMSVDASIYGVVQQAYEERFLFLLLLLRQPRARLVYVTSQAIHPDVIDYYLGLLPGVIASHARARLFLVSPLDGSPQPLSHKLLARRTTDFRRRRRLPSIRRREPPLGGRDCRRDCRNADPEAVA